MPNPGRFLKASLSAGIAAGVAAALAVPAYGADGRSGAGRACGRWIPVAAERHDVPVSVLTAVAYAESAWRGSPWSWTLNIDGRSRYFRRRSAAVAAMTRADGSMRTDVAVGCMQIHVRYHGDAFAGPRAMLTPKRNVMYAARFLRQLYERHGTWTRAVGHYHAGGDDPRAHRAYACRILHYQISLGYAELRPDILDYCSGPYLAQLSPGKL